ncbi:MAG: hypothetical protein ABIH23_19935 [bacterium]
MSSPDPLTVRFPRWIEESGLPERLSQDLGPAAWNLFRKLVEIEVEANLIPDWASVAFEDLVRWTGSANEEARAILVNLRSNGYIELRESPEIASYRISEPLSVPSTEAQIREHLSQRASIPGGMYLRYLTALEREDRVQRVVHFYQCCFGVSFTPKIAEDLEQIAILYDMGTIMETFEEAYRRKTKGLNWIKRRLAAESGSS